MKFYLSKSFRIAMNVLRGYLIYSAIGWVVYFAAMVFDKEHIVSGDLLGVLLLTIVGSPIFFFIYLHHRIVYRRCLYYTVIEDNIFTMYSNSGEKIYEIDTNKPVYYMIFKPCIEFASGEMIALSNIHLRIDRSYRICNFMCFDVHKMVFLPYNDETRKFIDRENWQKEVYFCNRPTNKLF